MIRKSFWIINPKRPHYVSKRDKQIKYKQACITCKNHYLWYMFKQGSHLRLSNHINCDSCCYLRRSKLQEVDPYIGIHRQQEIYPSS
ncbi:hypothetical protein Hanom_Chr10g00873001 [Helianthus anomalus]